MSLIPPPGTAERRALEREALAVGRQALAEANDDIAQALYTTYLAYRYRFLDTYGLLDRAPRATRDWQEALEDARSVERVVATRWAHAILAAYERKRL